MLSSYYLCRYIYRLCALLTLSLSCMVGAVAEHVACAPLPAQLKVDQVWGGTKLNFGTVESSSSIYIGYYDTDRWLAVSQVNKCTGAIRKVRLNSRFTGWDAHNYVTMALDKDGLVHMSGNMHVSKLIYSRMSKLDDLESLQTLQPITGGIQDRTTYPKFFYFSDGTLGFSYRYGQSGDGVEVIDRFDGTVWERWLDKPLFASAAGQKPVNAYHTGYILGPDGNFHVAWVWRANQNANTNVNVNYARSKDLKNWVSSDGKALTLPITPINAEVVDPVSQGQGLFNNIRLGFDGDARPVISYLKFDTKGSSQLFHARREIDGWKIHQSTQWKYRWNPQGGGTIPAEISFSGLIWRDGLLLERVTHVEIGRNVTFNYEASTLSTPKVLKNFQWVDALNVKRIVAPNTLLTIAGVKPADGNSVPSFAFSWIGMPADTRDQPRVCKPEVADCQYSFDLILHKLDRQ